MAGVRIGGDHMYYGWNGIKERGKGKVKNGNVEREEEKKANHKIESKSPPSLVEMNEWMNCGGNKL